MIGMLVFALVFGAVAPTVPVRATPTTVSVTGLRGQDERDKASADEKKRTPKAKAYPPPPAAAEAYMVVDLNTGDVLAARHPHKRMRPASTQKMLTALVLLPKLDRKAYYRATKADTVFQGTALGLHPGFRYSIDQLFHGMLVKSANDAANALARANGGIEETVAEMNAAARRIGARDTHADNPSGLDPDDDSPQYTSAHDLALIARLGMRHPDFRRYICTKSYAFPAGNGGTYVIDNTNRLLGKYPGMFGVKTGYTTKAGNTIVVAAEQNGRRVLVSALRINAPTYPMIANLLDWGIGAVGKVEPIGRMTLPLDPVRAARARFRAYALS